LLNFLPKKIALLAEDILTKKNIETRQPKIIKKKFFLDPKLKTVGPFFFRGNIKAAKKNGFYFFSHWLRVGQEKSEN